MRRTIIMIFAVIATMLSFNQKANAQKQVKVPVFEGVITAKKGTVNIRKEPSTQSEKIGTLEADISFYPILDQTEGWYRILVPDIDEESPTIDEKVTCGYVAKTFCKKVMEEDYPTSLSQMVYYLEDKLYCKNSVRKHGKFKQNIIVSGTFAYHYNEEGRCIGQNEGRFMGVAHKGVMVGKYVDNWLIPDNYDFDVWEKEYGSMSGFSDGNELTDQQIENALQYSQKAILYATPRSYDENKDYKNSATDDNMGIEIMYVDMDKYPFKYETIQFNDDESFSYFVVDDEEEELEKQLSMPDSSIRNSIDLEDSVLVQKCMTDLFYTLKYNMWEGKEYRFTDPFGSFLGETDLSLEDLFEAYDKKYRSGMKLDFRTLSNLKIDKKKEADGYSYSVRAKSVRESDKQEYMIRIEITPEKKINSFNLSKIIDL